MNLLEAGGSEKKKRSCQEARRARSAHGNPRSEREEEGLPREAGGKQDKDCKSLWPSTEQKTLKLAKQKKQRPKIGKKLFLFPYFWPVFPIFTCFSSVFWKWGGFLLCGWPRRGGQGTIDKVSR